MGLRFRMSKNIEVLLSSFLKYLGELEWDLNTGQIRLKRSQFLMAFQVPVFEPLLENRNKNVQITHELDHCVSI